MDQQIRVVFAAGSSDGRRTLMANQFMLTCAHRLPYYFQRFRCLPPAFVARAVSLRALPANFFTRPSKFAFSKDDGIFAEVIADITANAVICGLVESVRM